jgi:quercetin dioxygenase-like cupin family protein
MNRWTYRVVASLVVLAATSISAFAADAPAQAPAPSVIHRTILKRIDVPGSSYEVVYVLVEIKADSIVPRHTHPGSVMGYLLEGDYTVLINGQPPRNLRSGEVFEVPPGVVHEEHTGNKPAKILAVFTVEKGKPLSSPAP